MDEIGTKEDSIMNEEATNDEASVRNTEEQGRKGRWYYELSGVITDLMGKVIGTKGNRKDKDMEEQEELLELSVDSMDIESIEEARAENGSLREISEEDSDIRNEQLIEDNGRREADNSEDGSEVGEIRDRGGQIKTEPGD